MQDYSGIINREFKKNLFIVDPSQEQIVTDLPSEQVFELLEDLGHGTSGHVSKVLHKPSGKICAVKQLRRSGNDEENKRIYMDLNIVLGCRSDNIVRCCGYFIKDSEVWICMELMTTCFDKLMKQRRRPLPEKFLGAVAASILKGLDYLKDRRQIIHREVKPSNILINDEGLIKLCDFGISGKLINSQAKTRAAGCIWYMAPERVSPNCKNYDVRSDVWSLGMTLVELATAETTYNGLTDFDVLSQIMYKDPP